MPVGEVGAPLVGMALGGGGTCPSLHICFCGPFLFWAGALRLRLVTQRLPVSSSLLWV